MVELAKEAVTLIWLKRDLRLRDHAPLYQAAQQNERVILLYCWEPSLLQHPNMDSRHWGFVSQSLTAIDEQLPNSVRVLQLNMEVLDALALVSEKYRVTRIRSHQEIGLEVTHNRDKAVKHWALVNNVGFDEASYGGVIRGLPHRKQWQKNWEKAFSTRPFVVYVAPITDIAGHGRDTAKRLWDYKERDDVLAEAKRIVNRHTLSNSPSRRWVKQKS
ncbi:deoxyribodipyrimidine photo-lyase [Alteromonas profundi]|nr:deoxyribodipyrimidine photo-lyase [Alteromonas profundi]